MKTIHTKQTIKDLKNEPIKINNEEFTVGVALSNMLASKKTEFDAMKAWLLAQRFFKEDSVEVDDSDLLKIKNMIEADDSFTPLVRGQLQQAISL